MSEMSIDESVKSEVCKFRVPSDANFTKRGKNAAASLGTIADVVCARSLCNSVPLYPDPELRAAGGCDHPVH